jgi:hypothetical protein
MLLLVMLYKPFWSAVTACSHCLPKTTDVFDIIKPSQLLAAQR